MPITFPLAVTYAGSQGGGMAATIYSLGSLNGTTLEYNGGIAEFDDTQRYRVSGSPTSYDAILALNAGQIGYNAQHPYISTLFGNKIKLEKTTKEGHIMQVIHKRPPAGTFGTPDPLQLPFQIHPTFSFMQVPAEVDADDNVIINSTGDPYQPPQMIDICLTRIWMRKWQSAYSLTKARGLVGKVNDAAVTFPNSLGGPIPARCLKCLNFAPEHPIFTVELIAPIIYEFEFKEDLYDRKILDRGFQAYYKDKSDAVRLGKITMKAHVGEPPAEAVSLDGNGAPLIPDPYTIIDPKNGFKAFCAPLGKNLPEYVKPTRAGESTLYYLPYRVEREADFDYFKESQGF